MKNKKFSVIILIQIIILTVLAILLIYIFKWKEPTPSEVFKKAQNYVVEIRAKTGEDMVSHGSAVLIDDDGIFISNTHVVTYKENGEYKVFDTFEIRFLFETEYRKVELVKHDIDLDISVMKLNDTSNLELKQIKLGEHSKIRSGDIAYAVGNGMNHGISISSGIISLPQVNIKYDDKIKELIQSDITITSGNSGGALLDERGRLIGITTLRTKDVSGNINYGICYSIPIDIIVNYYKSTFN